MKVFMLRNPGTHLSCSLAEGETGTVSEAVGQALLAAGIAARIDEPLPPPVIQTVPPPPTIAEAKSPEIMPDASERVPLKTNFQWQESSAPVPIPRARKLRNKES